MSELVDLREIGDEIGRMNKLAKKTISNSHVRVYKPTLENKLSDEIIEFIYEDRGVSDEVSIIAGVITSNILKQVMVIIIQENILPDRSIKREGNYLFSGYGIKINVLWTFYNVGYESQITDEMRTSASAKISRQEMNVTLLSVRLEYNPASFRETIQHEAMHFFENFKRGYIPYKDQDKYNKAYGYLKQNNKIAVDKADKETKKILEYKNYIAKVIYISTAYEQRAFANGAYRYLMSHQEDAAFKFSTAMQGTKLFSWLKVVEKAIEFFNEYDGDLEPIDEELEDYGIDRIELMTIAIGARKNILRLIGRIVSKAMDDTEEQYPSHSAIIPESDEDKNRRLTEKWTRLNKKYFLS